MIANVRLDSGGWLPGSWDLEILLLREIIRTPRSGTQTQVPTAGYTITKMDLAGAVVAGGSLPMVTILI